MGYVAVDLDGTLARYHGWKGHTHIGSPIQPMVDFVRRQLSLGTEVRIFTARLDMPEPDRSECIEAIDRWCLEHLGTVLKVTNVKTFDMIVLYDDRAIQVEPNTGKLVCGQYPHPEGE
jgi:hypothetical protein